MRVSKCDADRYSLELKWGRHAYPSNVLNAINAFILFAFLSLGILTVAIINASAYDYVYFSALFLVPVKCV